MTAVDAPKCIAMIVAGGKGRRMASSTKKQYLRLDGIPVIVRTLQAFDHHPRIGEIVLVVPETDLAYCRDQVAGPAGLSTQVHIVPGGASRQASVASGLEKVQDLADRPDATFVLVHDGVRPFVPPSLVDACLDKAMDQGACIPVLEISDTVKQVTAGGRIGATLDRSELFRAQTPQAFRLDLLNHAFSLARKTGYTGTDEASILEHAGIPVYTVTGARFNIKLTTPADLTLAEFLLGQKQGESV